MMFNFATGTPPSIHILTIVIARVLINSSNRRTINLFYLNFLKDFLLNLIRLAQEKTSKFALLDSKFNRLETNSNVKDPKKLYHVEINGTNPSHQKTLFLTDKHG